MRDSIQIRTWHESAVRFQRFLVLFTAICVVPGCGGAKAKVGSIAVFPVHGTVTFNGEPVEMAVVTLSPVNENQKQPSSQGLTNSDGEFVLSTYNPNDGAPVGEYGVAISCEDREAKKINDDFPELLPVRYISPFTSKIKVKIEKGENELPPFELVK